jgi:hypothetical protein
MLVGTLQNDKKEYIDAVSTANKWIAENTSADTKIGTDWDGSIWPYGMFTASLYPALTLTPINH